MPPKTRQTAEDAALLRSFGLRVRALRADKALTQEQLAERAGIHAAEVGFLERAEREPGLIMLTRLAVGFDVTVSKLLEGLERGDSDGRCL